MPKIIEQRKPPRPLLQQGVDRLEIGPSARAVLQREESVGKTRYVGRIGGPAYLGSVGIAVVKQLAQVLGAIVAPGRSDRAQRLGLAVTVEREVADVDHRLRHIRKDSVPVAHAGQHDDRKSLRTEYVDRRIVVGGLVLPVHQNDVLGNQVENLGILENDVPVHDHRFAATLEQIVDTAVVRGVCRSAAHALDQLLALAESQVPRLVEPGVKVFGVEGGGYFLKAIGQESEGFIVHRERVRSGKLGKRPHFVEHQERALVAQHLEYRKYLDPQRLGERLQLVDLLAGQGAASLADFWIALEAKSVLEIEDQRVHLELGQEADHVLEVLHGGDLAVAELVVDAAHRHLWPVAHADCRQRRYLDRGRPASAAESLCHTASPRPLSAPITIPSLPMPST